MNWYQIVFLVVGLLVLFTLLLGFLAFHGIFGKPKRSTKVPKYYVGTPHYTVSRAGMAFMKTLPVEDVYLTSRDGLKLHAYLFPAEGGAKKKFVLGIHGYRSYARPEYGPYIEYYRSLGYSMLLPDDRAHAPSEGNYIGFGVLDRLDCVDWAKYLVEQYGEDVEIRLHGVSMGAATVLAASGEAELPKQVRSVVADCGYASAEEIISHHLKHSFHLPKQPFYGLCEWFCKHLAGFGFSEHTPLDGVRHAKVPILFVQGGKDWMVPPHMVDELYDACTAPKEKLFVPEAGHAESIAFEPEKYHAAIEKLFADTMPQNSVQ